MYRAISETELFKAMVETIMKLSDYDEWQAHLLVHKFASVMGIEYPSHILVGLSSLTTLAWGIYLALVIGKQITTNGANVLFSERAIKEFYNVYNIEE